MLVVDLKMLYLLPLNKKEETHFILLDLLPNYMSGHVSFTNCFRTIKLFILYKNLLYL